MRMIEIHQLNDFEAYDAIFFTEEGIIVDELTKSPLINFSIASKKLGININKVYLDGYTLIVRCNASLSANLSKQFGVYPARSVLSMTQEDIQGQIIRAIQWLTWNDKLQYCSKCGNTLSQVLDLLEKECSACGLSFYPNLAPAVMVIVQRDDQILLARSAHFKPGVYSAIAGFVDIGESAEETVYREVKEEVGIEVSQLEYFGSQSWPFSNSFMIAFKAQYLSGNLTVNLHEIEDAKWFQIGNLPALPAYPSISRKLIDSWRMSHI